MDDLERNRLEGYLRIRNNVKREAFELDDLECDRLERELHNPDDDYLVLFEPDENGISEVYKEGVFYYRVTTKGHNFTAHVHIPFAIYEDIYNEYQKKHKEEKRRKRQEQRK